MKIIGVVHLKALPGSPFCQNNLSEIYETALEDSVNLASIIQNCLTKISIIKDVIKIRVQRMQNINLLLNKL